ncbi:cytochrome P450 [Mycena maculata]|uniref:Cytochrome P450 n=1 Tax=Mycena maculata TaxID=230809 RepID=A0AAD7J667_9AGAR|nr:cytochrome P450 [Mycena maculata]
MPTVLLVVSLLLIFFATALYERGRRKQLELPSLGFKGIWASYSSSVTDAFRANEAIQESCRKYGDRLFTFAQVGQWVVVVKAKEFVQDYYNAPEDVLSMEIAAEELLQLHYTVGRQFCHEIYHISAIKTSLNQNLTDVLPKMVDEIVRGYADVVAPQLADGSEWTPIRALDTFTRIICRSSNRIFVGLPLCRNEDYCQLVSQFSSDVLLYGPIIKFLLPAFLRPLAGAIFQRVFRHHQRMLKHLGPMVMDRWKRKSNADDGEIENDMLTWLMDTAPADQEYSVESLAMRMLNVNFVAIHTTSKSFTHALYHLASKPFYIPILRAEIQKCLGDGHPTGWTKEALGRCIKLDSFLKESQRLNGMGALWMPRMAMDHFVFSDGTKISPGTFVVTAATAVHEDDEIYERPLDFDGLRFSTIRELRNDPNDLDHFEPDSDNDWKHRLTGTSPHCLSFGGGRHICPGRFFASLELKCLMAYLVLNYDVKTPIEGVRPADEWFGPMSNPARNAEILFRKIV